MSEPWTTDDAIITASDITGDALSDEATKKMYIWGSLTPMTIFSLKSTSKLDFTAQKSFFSFSCSFVSSPVQLWEALGGSEGTERARQAQS